MLLKRCRRNEDSASSESGSTARPFRLQTREQKQREKHQRCHRAEKELNKKERRELEQNHTAARLGKQLKRREKTERERRGVISSVVLDEYSSLVKYEVGVN